MCIRDRIYPFPAKQLKNALLPFSKKIPIIWVQEEPANMGALPFLRSVFEEKHFEAHPVSWVSRPESASPATGSGASHRIEQASLVEQAFQMSI